MRLRTLVVGAVIAISGWGMFACSSILPTTPASIVTESEYSLEQKVYSLVRIYEETVIIAADLMESENIPDHAKRVMADAILATEEPFIAVVESFEAYSIIQAEIMVHREAGMEVPEALLNSAAVAYNQARGVWQNNRDVITSFPNVIKLATVKEEADEPTLSN